MQLKVPGTIQREQQHVSRNMELGAKLMFQILDAVTNGEGHRNHMTLWNQHHLHWKETHIIQLVRQLPSG